VLSGAIGASESRLEVEVSGLPSLAALELLWESLPRLRFRSRSRCSSRSPPWPLLRLLGG
jgi:hypothetical protein